MFDIFLSMCLDHNIMCVGRFKSYVVCNPTFMDEMSKYHRFNLPSYFNLELIEISFEVCYEF